MEHCQPVLSVALLLVNEKKELCCVEELNPKPEYGKKVGDRSFPWETHESDESILRTLDRGIFEEVDESYELQMTPPNLIGQIYVCEGRVLVYVYLATYVDGPENMKGRFEGSEVRTLGWQKPEFILARCRSGVREVLEVWERFERELAACS